MKKILFYIALLFVVVGCEKSSYVAKFEKLPQERAAEQISLVSTSLTAASNGWIATLPTQAGGGYAFYMAFDKEQGVTMYGDITATSAQTSAKSYYRVKQDMGTELVFDTYNYISLLNDPNGTLGGANKIGYSSDIEFTFDKIAGDTMMFIGKKFRQPFKLVKATAAQQTSYLAGNLKTNIDKLTAFFAANRNSYIEITPGIKTGVIPDFSNSLANGKRIELSTVNADKSVTSGKAKIANTIDELTILNGGLVFQGIVFVKIAWKSATVLAMYDRTGKEYIINNNPVPLLEFKDAFKFNGAYNGIMISGRNLPAGITSGWNNLWAQQIASYDLNNVGMESMQFRLMNANTAKLEVWFVSGTTRYLADASYTYVINDDVITLSNYIPSVSNTNWNNGWVVTNVKNYFINASFRMSWVPSSDPSVSNIGGLYKIGDLTNFYYGRAIKN